MRTPPARFIALLLLALCVTSARAQVKPTTPLQFTDSTLAALSRDLAARSPTYAASLETLVDSPVPVTVGTPQQLRRRIPRHLRKVSHLAVAIAVGHPKRIFRRRPPHRSQIREILIVMDAPLFERIYRERGKEDALATDLQAILAHEITGHAEGWIKSGTIADGCLDPGFYLLYAVPDARGCAVDRENEVRRDLRILERPSYRLTALTSGIDYDEIDRIHLQARGIRIKP